MTFQPFMFKKLALTSSILLVLSGCSVSPERFTEAEIAQKSAENVDLLVKQSPPIMSEVNLSDAIARAIKNNREHKLKMLESVLAQGQLDLNNFDMLPDLMAKAGYSERDSFAASASTSFVDGEPQPLGDPIPYSVSQAKESTTSSVAFTWDVLDFGLSYVRAKQQSDRYLIAKERERKVVQNIVQDVRKAYYRAVTSEKLLKKIQPLIEQATLALSDSKKVELSRAKSPMEALSYQRNLLEVLRTLQSLRQDLLTAKTDLSRLMGVKPGESFQLADSESLDYKQMNVPFDLRFMEKVAMTKRPELIEAQYRERITLEETKSALMKLLPGLSLNAGAYYDDNSYLLNNNWQGFGAQVSWNLMNVFNYGNIDKVNEINQSLVKEQAIASSMAVLSQVHISNIRFYESKNSFDIASQYYDVSARIGEQATIANEMQSMGELNLIREKMNELLAELRRDVAHADMQNSFGDLLTSIGLDLVEPGYKDKDLETFSNDIAVKIKSWETGDFAFEGALSDGWLALKQRSEDQAPALAVDEIKIEPVNLENAGEQDNVQSELNAESGDAQGELALSDSEASAIDSVEVEFEFNSTNFSGKEELEAFVTQAYEQKANKLIVTAYSSSENRPQFYSNNLRLATKRGEEVKGFIQSLNLPIEVDVIVPEGADLFQGRIANIAIEK